MIFNIRRRFFMFFGQLCYWLNITNEQQKNRLIALQNIRIPKPVRPRPPINNRWLEYSHFFIVQIVDQWGFSHKDATQHCQLYQEKWSGDSLTQNQTDHIFKWQGNRTAFFEHCQTQGLSIRIRTYRREIDDDGKF